MKDKKHIKSFNEASENMSDVIRSFVVTYRAAYGLNIIIINSENIENAKLIADNKTGLKNSIVDGYEIVELDLHKKGVVFNEAS